VIPFDPLALFVVPVSRAAFASLVKCETAHDVLSARTHEPGKTLVVADLATLPVPPSV